MEYFKKGVTAPDTSSSHVKFDFSGLSRGDVWVGHSTSSCRRWLLSLLGWPGCCRVLRSFLASELLLKPTLQAALFSFLYLDLLDCTGTLFSMVSATLCCSASLRLADGGGARRLAATACHRAQRNRDT
jgi:hypothetical protein